MKQRDHKTINQLVTFGVHTASLNHLLSYFLLFWELIYYVTVAKYEQTPSLRFLEKPRHGNIYTVKLGSPYLRSKNFHSTSRLCI
jgi:hypothetical protein